MKRRESREKAMQIIFQLEVNEMDPSKAIIDILGEEQKDSFIHMLVHGVIEHKAELDNIIKEELQNWTMDRLANVEKSILRMATYEIFYLANIPDQVSINEAVELAKKFADEKSGKFVNGVLSKILNRKKD